MNRIENMSLCEYAGVSDSTSERVMITGKKKGKLIDSYEIVVRIQPEIWNIEAYG